MNNKISSSFPVWITVGIAFILWFLTFSVPVGNFWIKISISASILTLSAFVLKTEDELKAAFNVKSIAIGFISAVVLYFIFLTGQTVSHFLFSFSKNQIGHIYDLGKGSSKWMIMGLLFFITGPAEELYWRGFLQKRFAAL